MPLFLALMILMGAVYQLFFRFEHWIDPQQVKIVYERDNLTGQTHIIRPGEQVELFSRLVGTFGEQTETENKGPFAFTLIEETEESGRKKSIALADPIPEPQESPAKISKPDKNRSDLNRDGVTESVLINQTARDGLLDISVLEGQREVFYGRGQRISVLPTTTAGWSDIALEITPREKLLFRYNPAVSGYEVQSQ